MINFIRSILRMETAHFLRENVRSKEKFLFEILLSQDGKKDPGEGGSRV